MTQSAPEHLESDVSTLLPIASPREVLVYLGTALRRHPVLSVGVIVTSVVGAGASLVAVLALGSIVNAVRAGNDRGVLVGVALVVVVAALVTAMFTALSETMLATLIARLLATMREQVVAAVLCLPVNRIEQAGHGDALSRVGADIAVLVAGSRTAIPSIFSSSVLIVVSVAGLFTLDWRLALAGLGAAPAYVAAMRWYLPRSSPKYRELRTAEADHIDRLVGGIDGLTTVRAYGLETTIRDRVDSSARSVRDISISVFGVLERFVSRENRAEFIGLSLIIVVGWLLLRGGEVSLGQVAAATLLFHRLFNPIGAILTFFDEAQRSGAAMTRVVGVIDTLDPGTLPHLPPAEPGPVEIVVRGLRHHYRAGGAPAVDDVSLTIPAGTSLALVGASGAGKTTIASLIAGVLTPVGAPAGAIRYNDLPISDLSEDRIRAFTSVATQETHVFAGTLADDLRLARPDATGEQLWSTLAEVGADRWVRELDDALETRIGSGGLALDPMRAQQIALARLLLRDTPVVVLDESTAEAGSRGAAQLEAAAAAVTRGRTALIVAHRLSQSAAADAVAVIDGGRVVEFGTHRELLDADRRYAALWRAWSSATERDRNSPDVAEDATTQQGRIHQTSTRQDSTK